MVALQVHRSQFQLSCVIILAVVFGNLSVGCTQMLWVDTVLAYSSQYSPTNFAAAMVVGTPDVYPAYGDNGHAWCPSTSAAAAEYLVLQFSDTLYINAISIYETYHAGAVIAVSAQKPDGATWELLWSGTAQRITNARIFSPPIVQTPFLTRVIRLNISCPAEWCEIDAVQVTGTYDASVMTTASLIATSPAELITTQQSSVNFSQMVSLMTTASLITTTPTQLITQQQSPANNITLFLSTANLASVATTTHQVLLFRDAMGSAWFNSHRPQHAIDSNNQTCVISGLYRSPWFQFTLAQRTLIASVSMYQIQFECFPRFKQPIELAVHIIDGRDKRFCRMTSDMFTTFGTNISCETPVSGNAIEITAKCPTFCRLQLCEIQFN